MRNFWGLLLLLCVTGLSAQNNQGSWALPSADGDTVSLKDHRGKYVLLDFWFMGCAPCRRSIPSIVKIYEKHKDRLMVIGINPYDKNPQVAQFLKEQKITYRVALSERDFPSRVYHIIDYPTMILLDKNGNIMYTHEGFGDSESFEKEITKLIRQ